MQMPYGIILIFGYGVKMSKKYKNKFIIFAVLLFLMLLVLSVNLDDGRAPTPAVAIGSTLSFSYTGSVQTYTIPKSGTYRIDLRGSQGGSLGSNVGGKGGLSRGDIYLSAGTVLYIYVGEKGIGRNAATFNGGGLGVLSGTGNGAMSGGGATDVRIGGTSLSDRVIVAGGGGGAMYYTGASAGADGGAGGGLVGGSGNSRPNASLDASLIHVATGGTQTAGGTKASYNGTANGNDGALGVGGNGDSGGTNASTEFSGAGGSSYISGYIGCTENPSYVFSNCMMEQGWETNEGIAYITYMSETVTSVGESFTYSCEKESRSFMTSLDGFYTIEGRAGRFCRHVGRRKRRLFEGHNLFDERYPYCRIRR